MSKARGFTPTFGNQAKGDIIDVRDDEIEARLEGRVVFAQALDDKFIPLGDKTHPHEDSQYHQ